ncbi:hypothetical protein AAD018_011420 [Aestuariibius insulae]|uniref:hypothetical protein n=1 Tax=Aestuariibius insulae TaxID=2058287 RepID=UPI00345EB120
MFPLDCLAVVIAPDPKFATILRYRIRFDAPGHHAFVDGFIKPSMADELDALAAFIRAQEGFYEPR